MSGVKLKGFISKGKKVEIKEAPPELRDVPTPQEEFLDKKPSSMTTAVKEMFGKPKREETKAEVPKPEEQKTQVEKPQVEKLQLATVSKAARTERATRLQRIEEVSEAIEEEYDETLQKLEQLILEEDKGDHYVNEAPKAYVPETRRGFSKFIKHEYDDFLLKPVSEQEPVKPGEKYAYQKFVREYMRQSSPYRGVLVYHGLGSGKTCTAIATSEALYATSHKKIIVMTPFSLRKNFLKEVTFCGFRHYRLKNYWISLDKSDPTVQLFARKVLNVGEAHLKKTSRVWVPDFEQDEPNYDSLSGDEQTEIRSQILSSLVYDAKTNPTGRIRFINYNGITANALKEIACNSPDYFDNAVIIVDEIHNLIRLMQGKIEPYLTAAKGLKRKIVLETVGVDKWKPSLCPTSRNYKRGYLFYRLLLAATNSKIIGLSGTPLINFPEELGILSNVLHGYIPMIEGVVSVTGEEIEKRIENLLLDNLYTDFVRVEPDRAGGGIRILVTLLPEGVRKISNDEGVERIPDGVEVPSRQEILMGIIKMFEEKGFRFSTQPLLKALPLLPSFGEDFASIFLDKNHTKIENKAVLIKRLSGLISYYKGSRQDLMPKVIRDEVVRVPMSEYQQKMYSLQRSDEIDMEKTKEKTKGVDAIWSEVYEIANMKSSTSYRMGSRQVCNFSFPPNVTRPRTTNIADIDLEADAGDVDDIIDTAPTDVGLNDEEFPELPETGDEDEARVREEEERIDAEESQVEESKPAGLTLRAPVAKPAGLTLRAPEKTEESTGEPEKPKKFSLADILSRRKASQKGGDNSDSDESDIEGGGDDDEEAERINKLYKYAIKKRYEEEVSDTMSEEEKLDLKKKIKKSIRNQIESGELTYEDIEEKYEAERAYEAEKKMVRFEADAELTRAKPKATQKQIKRSVKQILEERETMKTQQQSDCKSGLKRGEDYKDAIIRAKNCLVTVAGDMLRLDNPEGLRVLSPKYAAMLQNITHAPGSSLIYSQFLDMEGVGIFRLVLDANGYAPIEIIQSGSGFKFSERTEQSLRKGSLQPRYITFSGAEKEDVRRLALDVFNARFTELPESLSKVLLESGFENNNNQRGQICRVFCITSAGAEGLSLKNVRAVHIMEPYWNDVRLKQVKGRAIRIGSHLDLPKKDQNVSIYTYITVYGPEAQRIKTGPFKIDETIFIRDSIDRATAIEAGIPIEDGIASYVLTSDERLYVISERKKKIIDELELVMKSAAVDCELNYAENKDGTYRCLQLEGKVGDFLYHPDIGTDIRESASMYQITEAKEVKKIQYFKYKGKRYAASKSDDEFLVYDPEDLETVIGTMGIKDDKPVLPILFK